MWFHAVCVDDAACNGKTQIRRACRPGCQNASPKISSPCCSSTSCSLYSAVAICNSIGCMTGTKSLWRFGTGISPSAHMDRGNRSDCRRSRSTFGTVLWFGSSQVVVSPKVPSHHPGHSRYSGRCLSGWASPALCRTVDSSSRYRVQSQKNQCVVSALRCHVCGLTRRRCIGNKSISPPFFA